MPRDFLIAGQAPKLKWKKNPRGKKRTIKDAIEIAKQNGVQIPNDVEFMQAKPGELVGSLEELLADGLMETARGPLVTAQPDGFIYWEHHFNRFDKIRFRIHPEILTSDEAIVGTFVHEMFELAELREV